MNDRLDVSVLICTRDRSAMLESCIDSVLACSPAPAEVIVVDQSGDDLSRQVVERRQTGVVPIRYLRGVGTGLSRAKNQGIPECGAAIIAFTDDDCLVDPVWLEALTEPIRGGRADAAVGRTIAGKSVAGAAPTFSVYSPAGQPVFSRSTHPWKVGGGANFAAGRGILQRSGPFDERFGPGAPLESAEDMDMTHRLLHTGARIVYSPRALALHQSWRSTQENRRLSRAYGIGAGGYFTKHLLEGDWLSGWRFAARLGIRTVHMVQAAVRLDWDRTVEQAIYLAALFEGAGRLLRSGDPARDGVVCEGGRS